MILTKFNKVRIIQFTLIAPDGINFVPATPFAIGDIKISLNENSLVNTTNLPVAVGQFYYLSLAAGETTAARITILIVDQSATKLWLDMPIHIVTYGNGAAAIIGDLDITPNATAPDNASISLILTDTSSNIPAAFVTVNNNVTANNLAITNVKSDTGAILIDTADIQPKIGTPVVDVSADILQLQNSVNNIATGSASISVPAESRVLVVGTETGTVADSADLDGVYHQITSVGGALDMYYQFDVTSNGVAVNITFTGRMNGSNDTIAMQAWDWSNSIWTQIGSIQGTNGSVDAATVLNLFVKHTGTGPDAGKVRVRGFAASGLTSGNLYIDQAFISFAIIVIQKPKRNVAFDDIQVLMVDSADNVTPKTGLILSVTRSIDSGAFVSVAGVAAEISNGMYQFDAFAADMNGDVITFKFSGTGADDTFITVYTKP